MVLSLSGFPFIHAFLEKGAQHLMVAFLPTNVVCDLLRSLWEVWVGLKPGTASRSQARLKPRTTYYSKEKQELMRRYLGFLA